MEKNLIKSVFHNTDSEDDDEDEEEEALSLCDLPLDTPTPSKTRRSSSEPPAELFEFLSSSEYMCPAEELIFRGKLIPSHHHHHHHQITSQNRSPPPFYTLRRRRSESLSELKSNSVSTRSNSITTSGSGCYNNGLLRNSRSLDYQKLRRLSSSRTSPDSDMDRNPSVKRSEKMKPGVNVKPRWYLFMFGIAKFPPEMDLRDIKSRQFRRNSSSVMMFPSSESDPIKGSGKNSWKFLKALSCKDHASIAVTTPFYVPHV